MRCVLMAALLSLATPAFADEFDNMMKTLNSRPVPKQLAGTVNQSAASASDVARFFSSAYDRLRTVGHVIKHPVDSVKEAAKTASKKALCAQAGASGKDCPADLLESVIDHPGNSHDDWPASGFQSVAMHVQRGYNGPLALP